MSKALGGFRTAVPIGWAALGVAGVLFAHVKAIPFWAALPVLAAFLAEFPFYLVTGFATARERLAISALPVILSGSLVLPYLLCCCGAIPFHWIALVRLAALGLALSLWYRVLPVTWLVDTAFLLLVGWVMLGHYFDGIYPRFFGQHLDALGAIGLVHVVVLVLMLERRIPETGWGFWPTAREWWIGTRHYFYFLAVGAPIALVLKTVSLSGQTAAVWIVAVNFAGFLWVSSLCDEFLFRGVLQPWMEEWTHSRPAGLVATSLIFGLAHLWFRGFPNWKWVPLAAVLGWFCGRARNQAESIRAGVVTHALVVATWRAFFA